MVGDHNGFDCKNFQTDEVHSIYGVMGFDVSDSWGQVPELPMDDGCFSLVVFLCHAQEKTNARAESGSMLIARALSGPYCFSGRGENLLPAGQTPPVRAEPRHSKSGLGGCRN